MIESANVFYISNFNVIGGTEQFIYELTTLEEVELVYVNKYLKKDKLLIEYNVVCNTGSVTENIDLYKKIIAIMEIKKTLIS